MKQSKLLREDKLKVTLKRLAQQLIENHGDFSNTVMIGIQPKGIYLAKRLQDEILELSGVNVSNGKLDITFYRDDFRQKGTGPLLANSTVIDFIVEDKKVILVDDVLWTGRTIRAAIDALQAFGRPSDVELLVLVDRRFSRQLPIQPDYIGIQIDSIDSQKVNVRWEETDGKNEIELVSES